MATPKHYKYWNQDGSVDYEQIEMSGRRVRNPKGYTGNRSVEYVRPGMTKVYYPDRTLEISFRESPQKFRRKVVSSMGGNVRPRENGNQIIVNKSVRDQVKYYDKAVKTAREDRIRAQVHQREVERKEREKLRKAQAQAEAKANGKGKGKGKKSSSRRSSLIPEGFAPVQSAPRVSKSTAKMIRQSEPKTVYQPKPTRWENVDLDQFF